MSKFGVKFSSVFSYSLIVTSRFQRCESLYLASPAVNFKLNNVSQLNMSTLALSSYNHALHENVEGKRTDK